MIRTSKLSGSSKLDRSTKPSTSHTNTRTSYFLSENKSLIRKSIATQWKK